MDCARPISGLSEDGMVGWSTEDAASPSTNAERELDARADKMPA